ncbi:hypothetical protein EVAR_13147_1 [Eumeta japonica]|uniref:Uncharacterized protein n=1 Tax=Eumeta variegata TaxID=151549 RepID=A0A4C1UB30_EUMVA|nr:hypothetical protein EVAR_13147_1 [Eumeta japonica]
MPRQHLAFLLQESERDLVLLIIDCKRELGAQCGSRARHDNAEGTKSSPVAHPTRVPQKNHNRFNREIGRRRRLGEQMTRRDVFTKGAK